MRSIRSLQLMLVLLTLSISQLWADLNCNNEKARYEFALQMAMEKNPEMKKSNAYDYKTFKTGYGYAYTLYFNQTPNAKNAHMVIVTMDSQCKILHIDTPTKSTFSLQAPSSTKPTKSTSCKTKGAITGDNHELSIIQCGSEYKFKASNDAISRLFSNAEVSKIRKIFETAEKKYATFHNKQTLYSSSGLKVWVRLYSATEWFLVFELDNINNYPSKASVWIPTNKFNAFTHLLK